MKTEREKELELEIVRLKKQVKRLQHDAKKRQYGLVWMDVPEAFEDDIENKLPIFKEVKEKAITNYDGKPTHILIEGDNYHALTCLNYTHKGKIDAIYIDPPYNIGNDQFRYKDKRILDKFPDGTLVPTDSPLRHSYWLSFMKKRLELAKNLLRDTGVIFISVDDSEVGQLRLLCNKIFEEKNEIGITVRVSNSAKNNSNYISITHDYTLVYARNRQELEGVWQVPKNNYDEFRRIAKRLRSKGLSNEEIEKELKILTKYPRFYDFDHYYYCDDRGVYRTDNPGGVKNGNFKTEITYPVTKKPCKKPQGGWRYSDKRIKEMLQQDLWHFGRDENTIPAPKRYLKDYLYQKPTGLHFYDSQNDAKLLKRMSIDFDFPKPKEYIKQLLRMSTSNDAIVLDFFAGSGTTTHAVIELNEETNGSRQAILVTNNENNICTEVCYPRIKYVIQGWTNKENKQEIPKFGNSLKYYRTSFVGKHNIRYSTDEDKIELAHQAGDLLAIAENTLYEVSKNEFYQFFRNEEQYTAVYFREELFEFDKFIEEVKKLDKGVTVYVFSWGENEFDEEFEDLKDVTVKPIPQPILEVYQTINNLG